jgi:hypothetical protein
MKTGCLAACRPKTEKPAKARGLRGFETGPTGIENPIYFYDFKGFSIMKN